MSCIIRCSTEKCDILKNNWNVWIKNQTIQIKNLSSEVAGLASNNYSKWCCNILIKFSTSRENLRFIHQEFIMIGIFQQTNWSSWKKNTLSLFFFPDFTITYMRWSSPIIKLSFHDKCIHFVCVKWLLIFNIISIFFSSTNSFIVFLLNIKVKPKQ